MTTLFLSLLKVSVQSSDQLAYVPSAEEWKRLYDLAAKHALLGVCFNGVQRLYKTQPEAMVNLPAKLKMRWLAITATVQRHNELMNVRCKELQQQINEAGLSACVLKGQGVATYYVLQDCKTSLANLRQSGDIDMWIKGGYDVVCNYVQRTHPSSDVSYHRFHYDVFKDTEVELHHRPSMMNSPFHNRKLQRWADEFTPDQFVRVKDLGFDMPNSSFNKIFLLCHIYRHFVSEGIGLRQLMDYYFVLLNSDTDENEEVVQKLCQIGMQRFTAAVMWMMQHLFNLGSNKMLCQPNSKEGAYVLHEILQAGNFGMFDSRYARSGRYAMQRQNIRHSIHLVVHYPSEVLWMPFWLIWHFFWKKSKVRKIKGKSKLCKN